MKISVIVPTYCPQDYLWECLDSLCAQTLAPEIFEIVIVLNGCDQPYRGRIVEYISRHPEHEFRLVHTIQGGVCHARNLGIDTAVGEQICFVDDDDCLSKEYLEKMLALAAPDSIVVSDVVMFDEKGNIFSHFVGEAFRRCTSIYSPSLFHGRSFLSSVWCKLIPRQVLAQDKFDERYILGEDALYMFLISKRIRSIVLASSDAVYKVRQRAQSASRSHYSYLYRFRLAMSLIGTYIGIYKKDIRHYDFLLFLSRLYATFRKIFYSNYR